MSFKNALGLKGNSAKPAYTQTESGPVSTGKGGLQASIKLKNKNITPSPGIEKTNSAS